jgi:hypothetical protein
VYIKYLFSLCIHSKILFPYSLSFFLLLDYLVLYSKANEAEDETDLGRKKRLLEKMEEAKKASVLLAQNSIQVRNVIHDRLPHSSPFPSQLLPKNTSSSSGRLSQGRGSAKKTTSSSKSGKKSVMGYIETSKSHAKNYSLIKYEESKVSSTSRPAKYTSAKSIPPPKTPSKKYISAKSIPSTSSKRKKDYDREEDYYDEEEDDDDDAVVSESRRKRQRRVSYKEDTTLVSSASKKNKKTERTSDGLLPSSMHTGTSSSKRKGGKPVDSNTIKRDETTDPYLKRRIAKEFDGNIYFGAVKFFTPASDNDEGTDLWGIKYDDGDAEDFEEDELMNGFLLYRKHASKDVEGKSASKRAKLKISSV